MEVSIRQCPRHVKAKWSTYSSRNGNRIVTVITDVGSSFCQRLIDSANLEFFVHADDVPRSALC